MYIEVYAIGALLSPSNYIAITLEGNSWLWLNYNINDDPFDTELDLSSCTPRNPFCANYVSGPTPDAGYYDGTNIGIYAVPPAVASAWLADGYISVNTGVRQFAAWFTAILPYLIILIFSLVSLVLLLEILMYLLCLATALN
jgi:hypothetical protein